MVIFLYGDDSFRSYQKLLEIKQKYLASDKSGSGLSSFSLPEDKNISGKIKEVFGMPNLFSSKRLLIIKNLILEGLADEQKSAEEFLKNNIQKTFEDGDSVVVFWEREMPKKNNALYKILEKNAKSQNFERFSGAKLNQWIVKRIKEINPGASISKTALDKLVVFCGNDTQVLNNEIKKLESYTQGKMISDRDVEELVRAKMNANIFQTVDALSSGNKKNAFEFLHSHLAKGDDPFYLMSMFVYQFRNLIKISELKEKNISEFEIIKITKLHPFVVKKSLAQLRNFSFLKLKDIYAKLLEIDIKVKTGKMDMKMGLDKFIVEI